MPNVEKKGSAKPTGTANKTKKRTSKRRSSAKKTRVRRYIWGICYLFLSLIAALTLIKGEGFLFGACYRIMGSIMGTGACVLPLALFAASVLLFIKRRGKVVLRVSSLIAIPFLFGAMLHVYSDRNEYMLSVESILTLIRSGREFKSGGLVSGAAGILMRDVFTSVGAFVILLLALLFALMYAFRVTPMTIYRAIKPRFYEEYTEEEDEEEPLQLKELPVFSKTNKKRVIDIPIDDVMAPSPPEEKVVLRPPGVKTPAEVLREKEPEEKSALAAVMPSLPPEPVPKAASKEEIAKSTQIVAQEISGSGNEQKKLYGYPPITLLSANRGIKQGSQAEIRENSERLIDTLQSFGIEANIINITRGPTVTRYEIQVTRGTKFSRITTLSDDIALSLGAVSVRIAPIPDKMAVGIEVPNQIVQTVYIRDVIASEAFSKSRSRLTFAVGRDITGTCVVGDIAEMPHMLIAGTTGSGKSVCINSLLISLLYKASPEEVRLIMIDPKMIELGIYNGIPHLLIPVVTDPKKAAGALNWAVTEMMRRYKLFSELNVRDLPSYNEAALKLPAIEGEEKREALPQIVIVIDELADLMFVAAHDVENAICRIAQMARAAGMHLVIATQRPSADVITGIMKANIPSRIAFAVASQIESRIILDSVGAEKLIGRGDMLYNPLGAGKPVRVQGCFITSQEIESVIEYIKKTGQPDYSEEVLQHIERETGEGGGTSGGDGEDMDADDLLPDAIGVVVETGQASVSMLQRRLKLGYSRAARLVDQMEERGIVGPFEGSKPRQVLITKEEWQEMVLRQRY